MAFRYPISFVNILHIILIMEHFYGTDSLDHQCTISERGHYRQISGKSQALPERPYFPQEAKEYAA